MLRRPPEAIHQYRPNPGPSETDHFRARIMHCHRPAEPANLATTPPQRDSYDLDTGTKGGDLPPEELLRLAEARFGYAFDAAAIGMCLVGLDGRILRANAALTTLVDRPAAELVGQNLSLLTHPDDRDPIPDSATITVAGETEPTFWTETRF